MATVEIGEHAFDPNFVTVSELCRVGDGTYKAILAWVGSERSTRQARVAANEKELRAFTASLQKEMEERHALQAAWASRNLP